MLKEASFYTKERDNVTNCFLCNHFCKIRDGGYGICGVRLNRGGRLYALSYGQVIAAHIDPIEKKPLFHFLPGSSAYSIACVGCNFQCGFCQNWEISQKKEADKLGLTALRFSPERVVEEAIENKCISISYTYTEPTIYFEFAYDCAKLAKEKGLYNNFVTNGYMGKDALRAIAPYLDAANVDIKAFREDFYHKVCKASLKPVLENVSLMRELNIWVEVTTLIVPGQNDDKKELAELASFITSLDKNIPWHLSRFHPDYTFIDSQSTPLSTLEGAYEIGKEKGLRYVYIGNIYTERGENTYCPNCNKLLIERIGFSIERRKIKNGKCEYCGEAIAGIGL